MDGDTRQSSLIGTLNLASVETEALDMWFWGMREKPRVPVGFAVS